MPIYAFGERRPTIAPSAYVHETAVVIGDVEIHAGASIWPTAVLRGDNEKIVVGENTNVQDGAVVHADPGFPVHIGKDVSVGHQAMLHGCTIGQGSLIGIHAVVLNGARVGPGSLVGAAALVGEGKDFADGSLILGMPAKVVKALPADTMAALLQNAAAYRDRAARYAAHLTRIA